MRKSTFIIGLISIVVLVVAVAVIFPTEERDNTLHVVMVDKTNEPLDRHSFEAGKSVGRNAAIQYLLQNIEREDTVRIDIKILLDLEDTLSIEYKFK